MSDIVCSVCGTEIEEGKMHITFPKLAQYSHPEKIEFEEWCDACYRSFYDMYNYWRVQRTLGALK